MAPAGASAAAESSPTVPPLSAEPSIGYIALDDSQAYVQAITGGIREAAADLGIGLVECDAGWTRPGVRTCATELAEAGVHGVISMQPFADLNEDVCATVGGVPTIGILYDQGPCQVSLFEIDQAESGRLAGAALGTLAADRWDCDVRAYVSLEAGADDVIGGARMDGFRTGYKEHCAMPKQKRTLTDAQHQITAQTQMGRVLDEIKGRPIIVAGVSDVAVMGAMNAARQRERSNHTWNAGQLADPVAHKAIACDPHFVASVAQFPERFGATVVPALGEVIEGGEMPATLDAELALVTASNIRDVFPEVPACDE